MASDMQGPERIYTRHVGTQIFFVGTKPLDGSTPYIRADLYDELQRKLDEQISKH